MKLFARIFALSLVATGAFASTQISKSATPVVAAHSSLMPIPVCDPNSPEGQAGCGMGSPNR